MSQEQAYRTAYLIAGFIRGTLTDQEKDELDDWIAASEENIELFAELTDEQQMDAHLKERYSYNSEAAIEKLRAKMPLEKPTVRRTKLHMFSAVAAAVSVLLLLAIFLFKSEETKPEPGEVKLVQDVAPGSYKALLTVSGGKQLWLDSNSQGKSLGIPGLEVADSGNALHYSKTASAVEWHTLSTPRSGQYKLQLPDSSIVWLNAESSIRFPSKFPEDERKVEVSGELYFEVAKDEQKKFIVVSGDKQTEVLGTHFNVSAYNVDSAIVVTLLEGRVQVRDNGTAASQMLQPREQALFQKGKILLLQNINVEEVIAWKNGWFYFNDQPIGEIMQQVARWYDVKVLYDGTINQKFTAEIEKNVTVVKLLELLEKTGRVHFKIKDKTITVTP